MAPNRQAGESSRRVNRHLNASPYARKVPNQAKSNPQADAGQVKKTGSLASLFSIFNPFSYLGKRTEPPQSLPQLRARNDSSSQEEEEQTGHESDTHTELDVEGDSMFVDHALQGPLASSQKSPEKHQPSRVPFPLVSPAKNWDTAPGTARRGNVAPTANTFSQGLFTPASPASSAHTSATVGHTVGSPLKPIQDFLGRRTRAGAGLSAEEVQQLTGMLSAQSIGREESDLPTAAFLARDFSPNPSKSFLAPQQASSSPFRFEAGNNAGSTALSTASQSRQRRHRPVYVGPGQGSNLRPSRSSIVMPPISSSLPRPSISSTVVDPQPSEDLAGKRRRVDGLSSNAPPSLKTQEANATTIQNQPAVDTHSDTPPTSSTTSTGTSKSVPSLVSARGGPLRGHATASPAVPSPLRNMTKAEDPPSPPRRSLTSAAVMNILAKADKELSVSESKAEVEQAIVNPYERSGPKIPLANRRKPIPVKKSAPSPPKAAEPKKPDLPSSAQVIADSLPTPKAQAAKPSANGNTFRAPFSKPTVSSSPFLPPGKAAPPAKANGSSSGPFTVDDVDDEDEIMEITAPEGSSSKSQANGSNSRARGLSPPSVEELDDEEMGETSQKASRPSLVVEPTEPRQRIGRSPSIGPYSNSMLYSPTIPSPLRLVSMPEEDELVEDIDIPDAAIQPKQSIPRAPALRLVPNKSSDTEMVDDSDTDPKSQAEKAPVPSLPSYNFDFTITAAATVPGIDISAKAKASAVLKTELPKFDMLAAVPVAPAPAAPINNWAAAGFVPKAATGGSWTCDQCMLSNPESAKDKCTICDADRPGAKAKPTSAAPPPSQPAPVNNWAASGFAIAKPAAGTWTCSVCMLSNPASVTDKCTVCGADAPGSAAGTNMDTQPPTMAPPAQPTAGFNWSAAGFKPQTVAPGTWTCSVCGLKNGPELTKCSVCEAAR